jgi:hypothetical protein
VRNFVTTDTLQADGRTRVVTLDTPAGGSLDVDCLGGPTRFRTLEPLVIPSLGACATGGLLETKLLSETLVTATRYTPTGGIQFDFGFSGDRASFRVALLGTAGELQDLCLDTFEDRVAKEGARTDDLDPDQFAARVQLGCDVGAELETVRFFTLGDDEM